MKEYLAYIEDIILLNNKKTLQLIWNYVNLIIQKEQSYEYYLTSLPIVPYRLPYFI